MAVSAADARILAGVDPLMLSCPFVVRANAEAAQIQRSTLLWLQEMKVEVKGEMFDDISEVGFLTAHTYPNAHKAALKLAADWTTLFFLLDDLVEGVTSEAVIQERNQRIVDALRGKGEIDSKQALLVALRDIGTRAEQFGGDEWMAAFCLEVSRWLDSHLWEYGNRQAQRVPALEEYTAMRQYTIGMYFEFLLSELTDGYGLSAAERNCEAAVALRRFASSEIAWTNDILTLEKELAQGDVHNGVLSLMHTQELKLDVALARAIALHNEAVGGFVELAQKVRADAQVSSGMLGLVQALENWMGGHTRWARQSKRYGGSRPQQSTRSVSSGRFEQSL